MASTEQENVNNQDQEVYDLLFERLQLDKNYLDVETEGKFNPDADIKTINENYVNTIIESVYEDFINSVETLKHLHIYDDDDKLVSEKSFVQRLLILHPDTQLSYIEFITVYKNIYELKKKRYIVKGSNRSIDNFKYEDSDDEEENKLSVEQIQSKLKLKPGFMEKILKYLTEKGMIFEYFITTSFDQEDYTIHNIFMQDTTYTIHNILPSKKNIDGIKNC
ncbi:MAG: hypothetical protein Terrestrivirus3_78 [Terrestrivirus sp.]|uniref:Uncharacterized protein n=1 Tax=Terrestrivirus sp. TaxID=2487775 RepID=A0A3G4ZQU4_9VIRU|nr:MAG: hypothetical protein Terrestrivirus3_78 [Terrestrivirus sp.]